MKKETKKTFTYAAPPSAVQKAKERAERNHTSLSELISDFVVKYSKPRRSRNKIHP